MQAPCVTLLHLSVILARAINAFLVVQFIYDSCDIRCLTLEAPPGINPSDAKTKTFVLVLDL